MRNANRFFPCVDPDLFPAMRSILKLGMRGDNCGALRATASSLLLQVVLFLCSLCLVSSKENYIAGDESYMHFSHPGAIVNVSFSPPSVWPMPETTHFGGVYRSTVSCATVNLDTNKRSIKVRDASTGMDVPKSVRNQFIRGLATVFPTSRLNKSKVHWDGGYFHMKSHKNRDTKSVACAFTRGDDVTTLVLDEGLSISVLIEDASAVGELLETPFIGTPADASEGYTLKVSRSEGVTIRVSAYVGFLWALQTLRQIIVAVPGRADIGAISHLPVLIKDAPLFSWRGLMIDTARHFIPATQLHTILEGMSMAKINIFHWHLSDAESFPYDSKRWPKLKSNSAFTTEAVYTKRDIIDIVLKAAYLGIRVVPEINMPAHAASWGSAYSELVLTCPGATDGTTVEKSYLNPLKNFTYHFIGELLTELKDAFYPLLDEHVDFGDTAEAFNHFHFGGNKMSWDCMRTSEEVLRWANEHNSNQNMTSPALTLQNMFTQRVLSENMQEGRLLARHNRIVPVFWEDVLELGSVKPPAVIQFEEDLRDGSDTLPSRILNAKSRGFKAVLSSPWKLNEAQGWYEMYESSAGIALDGGYNAHGLLGAKQ